VKPQLQGAVPEQFKHIKILAVTVPPGQKVLPAPGQAGTAVRSAASPCRDRKQPQIQQHNSALQREISFLADWVFVPLYEHWQEGKTTEA